MKQMEKKFDEQKFFGKKNLFEPVTPPEIETLLIVLIQVKQHE